MAEETTVIKGAFEDHQGRVIHPETEADLVALLNGKSVEAAVAEILAMFAGYLPKSGGGTVSGLLNITGGRVDVNQWASLSAGTDGFVMLALNAYKGPTDNKYYYRSTHADIGARGIIFRYGGDTGIGWFDTGMIATTADAEFTPTIKSLTNPDAELITGQNLNSLTKNGHYCGSGLTNAPFSSSDWWYVFVQNLTDNSANYVTQMAVAVNQQATYVRTRRAGTWGDWERMATITAGANAAYIPIPRYGPESARGGYIGFPDSSQMLYLTNEQSGGQINLSAPGGVLINGQRIPSQYHSTSAPSSSDGQDGDVWDVYV